MSHETHPSKITAQQLSVALEHGAFPADSEHQHELQQLLRAASALTSPCAGPSEEHDQTVLARLREEARAMTAAADLELPVIPPRPGPCRKVRVA